jgi:hypothetical protein
LALLRRRLRRFDFAVWFQERVNVADFSEEMKDPQFLKSLGQSVHAWVKEINKECYSRSFLLRSSHG